jgi:hypothetical protein
MKLIDILTSRATKDQIVERMLGSKKTSAAAIAVTAIWGAAAALYEKGFILAASLVAGLGGLVAVIGLLLAKDGEPPSPAPPSDPTGPAPR